MIKRLFVFISFLTLGVISTRASLYRIYQTSNGLSHNSVWAVMQDSEGFMWFGRLLTVTWQLLILKVT